MTKITTRIDVPTGQKATFNEVPSGIAGVKSYKPNAAMQQEILEAVQKRFPGLVLVDGVMTLKEDL